MPPHISSLPPSPPRVVLPPIGTSSPEDLTHLIHFMALAPAKHPDDILPEKIHLWRTQGLPLTQQLLRLSTSKPFALKEAQTRLDAVKTYENCSQEIIEQTTRLERPALQALALDSTLKEHRKSSVSSSRLDWLDMATDRAQAFYPISSRLTVEQQQFVNPQSLLELRAAVSPAETRLKRAVKWIKTPLQYIVNAVKHHLFPKQVSTVQLPAHTEKMVKRTLQGSSPKKEAHLGSGTFGEVISTRWNEDVYALKQLFSEKKDSGQEKNSQDTPKARLIFEGAAYMSLDHPNIVKVQGISEEGLYLEQVPGKNFKEILDRKHLSQKELSTFLIGIAEGLRYLHSKGYTHKDVKLTNVLIDPETQCAKLCDLGLIANSEKDTCLSGSLLYQAPELTKTSEKVPVSQKADVWSFGILLYNALANESRLNPFPLKKNESITDYKWRRYLALFMKPCSPEKIFSILPSLYLSRMKALDIKTSVFHSYGLLQKLIVDCLHGDPAKRPSMEEVVTRLQEYQKRIH